MNTNANENIISINEFRAESLKKKEESSLIRYYKLLNFHDLVSEANAMINEFDSASAFDDIALKSQTLLKEFQARAKSESPILSGAIKQISSSIETNLERLKVML